MNIYEIITNKIVEKLEKGVVPWRRPWNDAGLAVNWLTQRPYRGINALLLEPGEYATFRQIQLAGGKVKKGAKSEIIVFWKWIEKEDEETGETISFPILRYYRVFEINTQCEGIQSKRKVVEYDHDPIEEAEKIILGYQNAPKYTFNSGRAYYQPLLDRINVPPLKDFMKPEEYYSTFFHEMVHSTGHPSRLNRPGIKNISKFGSESYSKEELIAEMGSAFLCAVAKIDTSTIDNSASYVAGWLRALKNDKRLVVLAAAQAQKAVDYILGR